ncbi:hypothetical protein AVEN_17279-1 [Araneus ventricosus]|uniref:Uncharacterized protein n=1 Tax=Araneus ventricosus TaxID=182803 RepID=A0A4Y2PAP5_ARAVE|nr:hypothetical protein AVEN_17279-1 [Araneus ventricosus]
MTRAPLTLATPLPIPLFPPNRRHCGYENLPIQMSLNSHSDSSLLAIHFTDKISLTFTSKTLPSVVRDRGQLISSCGDPPQKQPASSVSSRYQRQTYSIRYIND